MPVGSRRGIAAGRTVVAVALGCGSLFTKISSVFPHQVVGLVQEVVMLAQGRQTGRLAAGELQRIILGRCGGASACQGRLPPDSVDLLSLRHGRRSIADGLVGSRAPLLLHQRVGHELVETGCCTVAPSDFCEDAVTFEAVEFACDVALL